MSTLRVFNGDSAAGSYGSARPEDDVLVTRDAVAAGPAPAVEGEGWIDARAAFLAGAYGGEASECRADLERFGARLEAAIGARDIDLWFGHDLFCLISLLHLGAQLAAAELGDTRIGLVCPDGSARSPAFGCLGELTPLGLIALEHEREELDRGWLDAAAAAWAAYTSPDPTGLAARPVAQPRIARALALHAARFPDIDTGLGRIEAVALERLASAPAGFGELFAHHCDALPDYGWGDLQFAADMLALADRDRPLVSIDRGTFRITDAGRAALQGDAELGAAARGGWLGGVELAPGHPWRYDAGAGAITRAA